MKILQGRLALRHTFEIGLFFLVTFVSMSHLLELKHTDH